MPKDIRSYDINRFNRTTENKMMGVFMKTNFFAILTLLFLAFTGAESQAMLLVGHRMAENGDFLITGLGLTTLPPLGTLLLGDSKISITTEEAQIRLISEANGDMEALLISKIADQLNTSKENVAKSILAIDAEGEEISLENIKSNL